jgi:DNA uptake protein ComE-like DNA-binding protein
LLFSGTAVENGAVKEGSKSIVLMIAVLGSAMAMMPQTATRPAAIPAPEARVDINHASVGELMKVPGMSESWAGRIVRYRPYRTKQDLLDKGIVNSQVYDRIKDYVIAHREKQRGQTDFGDAEAPPQGSKRSSN